MATAEEVLSTMTETSESTSVLVVNSDLRTIAIPPGVALLGVESDEDVHVLHFSMPRYYSGFDLSTFTVRINYRNANKETDSYIVTDAETATDEIAFSWLVGRNATRYRGTVNFIVCLQRAKADGAIEQEFNTTLASLPVLEGIEVEWTNEQEEEVRDIVLQLLGLTDAATDKANDAANRANQAATAAITAAGAANTSAALVARVTVSAQTLESGMEATASGSISPETGLTLEFGIPAGPPGPKGDPGQDAVLPSWVGDTKPTYTAAEVGAAPATHTHSEDDVDRLISDLEYIYTSIDDLYTRVTAQTPSSIEAEILAQSWEMDDVNGTYVNDVDVVGFNSDTDDGIVDYLHNSNAEQEKTLAAAWARISYFAGRHGGFRAVCTGDPPDIDIPVRILAIYVLPELSTEGDV